MPRIEEWDWPPPRRSRADQIEIESRIVEERIVVPRGLRASRPAPARQKDGRLATVAMFVLKAAIAVPLAGVVVACVWLIGILLKA